MFKGVIWCSFKDNYFVLINKDYYFCCNRMCWHALMFKKHIIFQLLYIIVVPLFPASLKGAGCFLQSSSFQQVQSSLIGQLTQCFVIGRTSQKCVGYLTPLTIIASFNFQVSFTSSSPERGTESLDRQWLCSYVFAVHKPQARRFLTGWTLRWDVTLFPSHTHTHNVLCAKSAFEQSIAK